jgi:hypothetical protein
MIEANTEREAKDFKTQAYHTRQICWLIYQSNADPKNPRTAKTIDAFWDLENRKAPRLKRNQKSLQQIAKELEAKLNNR